MVYGNLYISIVEIKFLIRYHDGSIATENTNKSAILEPPRFETVLALDISLLTANEFMMRLVIGGDV